MLGGQGSGTEAVMAAVVLYRPTPPKKQKPGNRLDHSTQSFRLLVREGAIKG
jgi:hypothetical protein